MAPSRDSLATPLSHDVRQTGGFASPPFDGFAHFNAFASLQLPRIAPTMYSHFEQLYRCSLSLDPLLSQMQAAGVDVLTADWPNWNPLCRDRPRLEVLRPCLPTGLPFDLKLIELQRISQES
jgi:hypothetical protein